MKKIISTLDDLYKRPKTKEGTDGENNISKKKKPVKDCFESLNRATFALNQAFG